MRYLITGHTGFKGAWLTVLLKAKGHEVSGFSLDPDPGALYEVGKFSQILTHDFRGDIRSESELGRSFAIANPEVVIHLAAQPLVRRSYREPRFTVETNVMGTFNVLEAASKLEGIKALVIATTDKVYRNVNRSRGYREDEALGGFDPYSSSKAMADLLSQSWAASFPGVPTAVVRAGNVIGGGDVSEDRLLVDLVKGFRQSKPVPIRYPDAVRPWQHVLDCLNGYLQVSEALLAGTGQGEWNVGPDSRSFVPVRDIAEKAASYWGDGATWNDESDSEQPHEAGLLALDATKIQQELHWRDFISYPESLLWTIEWEKGIDSGMDPMTLTEAQIFRFLSMAGNQ